MKKYLPLLLLFLYSSISFSQTDLIISEYIEGWSNNKALELYNPTDAAINLSGYRLTRYSNGSNVPLAETQWYIDLPDYELQPYRTYVVVIDQRDPGGSGQDAPVWEQLQQRADVFLCPEYEISYAMYFNGDDAVALEETDGTLIDLFARWGAPRPAEAALPEGAVARAWTNEYPHFTGLGKAITADHTLIRKSSITAGVTTNPSVFDPLLEYDSLEANTFEYLGWHIFDGAPANASPEFSTSSYEFVVTEQASIGTIVGTPTATDAEEDDLTYYLNSGNFVYINDVRYIPFIMDKLTGQITVNDPNALIVAERDTFYLNVSVHDGYTQADPVIVMVRVTQVTGIYSPIDKLDLKIYPNPVADEYFNISYSGYISTVYIANISGRILKQITNKDKNTEIRIPVSELRPGIYMLKICLADQKEIFRKLVVQ